MDSFHQMAVRVAQPEEAPDEVEEAPEEFEPRWSKVKTVFQSKVKPAVKDLEQAIRNEDVDLAGATFERLIELVTGLAKGFGMRDLTSKLKTLEKKTFD